MTEIGDRITGISSGYRFSTFWEKETSLEVPLRLHFLWVGKEIPDKYIDNILSFIKYNEHYEVRNTRKFPYTSSFIRYLSGLTSPHLKRSEKLVNI